MAENLTPAKLAELRRMYDAAVIPNIIIEFGLCGCMTKTPDVKFHHPDCPYVRMERLKNDLAAMHNALPALLDMAGRVEGLEMDKKNLRIAMAYVANHAGVGTHIAGFANAALEETK